MAHCDTEVIRPCNNLHNRMDMVRHHHIFIHTNSGKMGLNQVKTILGKDTAGIQAARFAEKMLFIVGTDCDEVVPR